MKRRSFILHSLAGALALSAPSRILAEARLSSRVGYIGDPIFLDYHLFPNHPESPARYRELDAAMHTSGLLEQLIQPDLKQGVEDWLAAIHTLAHIQSIQRQYPQAYDVALAAVAAALAAVDQVAPGKLQQVFCGSRPPGHHALNTGKEEGFCYFNQAAIAARYAQRQYGLEKIMVVDWDYHHGNSTEAMFYEDPSVLFFSTHDQHAYPGTGDPARTGAGAGKGFNINVHLPCETTDAMIVQAFEEQLLPAAKDFKPDLVLVSAGFDSRKNDRLGCFGVTDDGFRQLTHIVKRIANEHCEGRLVSILEGGYNLKGNAAASVAHVSALLEEAS